MHIASSKKPAGRGHTLCDILEKVKLQTVRRAVCVRNWGRRRDVDFQGGEPSVDLHTTTRLSHPQNSTAPSEPQRALWGSVSNDNASTLAHRRAKHNARRGMSPREGAVGAHGNCFLLGFPVNLKLLSELTSINF